MNILNNWDRTPAYDGQGERMTPGGHICKIMDAKVETSRTGREQMVLALEIAENSELDGFYGRQFQRRRQNQQPGVNNAVWPCRFFQGTQDSSGNASPYFKGMIKAIEESNAAYKWNWQESSLKGLKIGFIFREEEYADFNGEIRTNVKPAFVCSVQRVREGVEIPAKKTLEGSTGALPVQAPQTQPYSASAMQGFTPVEDDALPF